MLHSLGVFRNGMQWLFTLVLAVVVGRFTYVAGLSFMAAQESVPVAVVAPPSTVESPVAMPTPAEPAKPNDMIKVLLLAHDSRGRSKVFVNGVLMGYTAFMQDFSCRRGEVLTLSIAPPNGQAIERQLLCKGETLSISDKH